MIRSRYHRTDATPTGTSELASLSSATEWLNSSPLTEEDLRGRVVLVQFWTYSCINWIRTLPYIRSWDQKYRDKGLVVIGVHAPEFGFERQLPNVRWAAESFGVGYPVAVDNDFSIWRAFGNQYWPALYIIDVRGRVRHRHFGEGDYERSERIIQELLAEAGGRSIGQELATVAGRGTVAEASSSSIRAWRSSSSPSADASSLPS